MRMGFIAVIMTLLGGSVTGNGILYYQTVVGEEYIHEFAL